VIGFAATAKAAEARQRLRTPDGSRSERAAASEPDPACSEGEMLITSTRKSRSMTVEQAEAYALPNGTKMPGPAGVSRGQKCQSRPLSQRPKAIRLPRALDGVARWLEEVLYGTYRCRPKERTVLFDIIWHESYCTPPHRVQRDWLMVRCLRLACNHQTPYVEHHFYPARICPDARQLLFCPNTCKLGG